MPYPYIDTPRTEVDGNATYLNTGYGSTGRTRLSALDSVENSFATPSKENDIIKAIEDARKRNSSTTLRINSPPAAANHKQGGKSDHRRQFPTAGPARREFTPLMESATRNNMLKKNRVSIGGPDTPAYPKKKKDRSSLNTPGLPEASGIEEEDQTSSDQVTPVPQAVSSSPQGTPLPMLPGRDSGGILSDGQNMMTLKEQEKVTSVRRASD